MLRPRLLLLFFVSSPPLGLLCSRAWGGFYDPLLYISPLASVQIFPGLLISGYECGLPALFWMLACIGGLGPGVCFWEIHGDSRWASESAPGLDKALDHWDLDKFMLTCYLLLCLGPSRISAIFTRTKGP